MTFDINLNTIIELAVAGGVAGVYREFRRMNGTLRGICQWKTDHLEAEKSHLEDQRRFCDTRHQEGKA